MKNIPLVRKAGLIRALLFCLFSGGLHAQTFEEENTKAMARIGWTGWMFRV
jgi:hypothetical protein